MLTKLILGLATLLAPTLGYLLFQDRIPNGNNIPHPCKPNYRWPGVGHENPNGGGARNVFGQDFDDMGREWTQELCLKDSDGDGKTNGEELGDPSCTWSAGQIPERISNITHPGICDPYDSELCRDMTTFVSCELDQFEACDSINQPDVLKLDLKFPTTRIPPTETNYYCMTFDLPSDQDYHIIANEALIDNANVLHHMLLYGCDNPDEAYIPSPQPCGMSTEGACGSIISGWTVGQTGECYGNGIGYRIGATAFKRVRLEIHYNNPMRVQDYTDSSGLRIYYQPAKPNVKDLITFTTGQMHIVIPPGQNRVEMVNLCEGGCTQALIKEPAYIISAINHMHYLGRSMKIELFRNGEKIKDLTNDDFYSYDSPVTHFHDPPVQILPGDEIKTTCVYNSMSSKRYVYYGDGTSDEMCFGFLAMYPASALKQNFCVSIGPLSICQMYSGMPVGDCQWDVFSNLSNPEAAKIHRDLKKNCNLDGFCRPECKEYLEDFQSHPCMKGDGMVLMKRVLKDSYEGLDFLGRLHSCPMDGHSREPTDCRGQCSQYCRDDNSSDDSAHHMTATTTIFVTLASAVAMLQYL